MLPQQALIDRVHHAARADDRLEAALMYGSFAAGEGDAHSDIEFWLFFQPDHRVDPAAWLAQVGDVRHLVRNEFGTHVAFFPDLIRGEFHFATADDIDSVRSWPARGAAVERMLVVDRSGKLEAALGSLPEQVPASPASAEATDLCGRFANWLVLAHHVAARSEYLRAWDALGHVQRHLLWMTPLAEAEEAAESAKDPTAHWLTPSRAAEKDLPTPALDALRAATADASPPALDRALRAAWREGRRRWTQLAEATGDPVPAQLFAELDAALGD